MQPLGLVKLELWEDDILFIIDQLKTRWVHLERLSEQLKAVGRKDESAEYSEEGEKCKLTADVLAVLLVANRAR